MKLKAVIALTIIIFLAVYGLLGLDAVKHRKGHVVLATSIAGLAQQRKQVPAPPQDLEQRLAAAQASLAAVQSAFPGKPNSTQIINQILRLADKYQVKAIPLTTQQWSAEKAVKGYQVFRLQLTVQGSFPQFVNFVSSLEKGEFATLIIENLSVTRVKKVGETAFSDDALPVTAVLDVVVYARSD